MRSLRTPVRQPTGRLDIERHGWLLGGAGIALALAWSWWEILFLPLGDSHDGRINGRFGLQVRNLFDQGLVGSDFITSMEPFTTQPYAHHPPLLNIVQAVSRTVFGAGEWQLHLLGYVSGLATVFALLWLAQNLGFSPMVSVPVMALVAATPMFWIYARLGLGMTLMLVFMTIWVRDASRPERSRMLTVVGGIVAFSSWPGAALVLLVGGWSLRDSERVANARAVLIAGGSAVLLVVLWALTATTTGELVDHTASRLVSPVGFGEFVDQYRWFYTTLFPRWFLWLIPVALAASLISDTTRRVAGPWLLVAGAWTVALPEAAFVHDYWTYPLLAPIALGGMVLVRNLASRVGMSGLVAALLLALAVNSFVTVQSSGFREAYFHAPSDAGRIIRAIPPAPGQQIAWVNGIELPRWVSYYWDLPVAEASPATLEGVDGDELILLRRDRLPSWVGDLRFPVAAEGRYVLIRVGSINAP